MIASELDVKHHKEDMDYQRLRSTHRHLDKEPDEYELMDKVVTILDEVAVEDKKRKIVHKNEEESRNYLLEQEKQRKDV